MLTSSDFKELLNLFEKHKVRYLIVGGYAVMKYSEPRFTKNREVVELGDLRGIAYCSAFELG